METKGNKQEEAKQQLEEELSQLQDNPVFKVVQTQLMQLRATKRKEQRSALQRSDSKAVFRIEAEISGIEQFFKVYEGECKKVGKFGEDTPTVFKY